MKFKHKVDTDRGIVIVKAESSASIFEVMYEIQKAVVSKRGEGIPRRLIDLTEMTLDFSESDIEKIFSKLKFSAEKLQTKRIAFIAGHYPEGIDMEGLVKKFKTDSFEIGVFIDKGEAVSFLNKRLPE